MLSSELPRLSAYLAALFAPGLGPVTFRTRAAQILREAIDCHQVSFAIFDPRTRKLDIDFDPFFPEMAPGLEGFGRHMAKYPCFNFDPSVNGGKPFLRGDFLSDKEFFRAPVYLEGFKVAGISDHAAILLPSNDGTIFFLGLEKRDGSRFVPAHRDRMLALQPHLANARLLAQSFTTLEEAATDPGVFARLGLSPRESETLCLIAAGKANAEIAAILGISLPTVKGHVVSVFDKLGVDNRHAATARAQELIRPKLPRAQPTSRRASTVAAAPLPK
ncbi:MAG: helix-turn-helix transcriptional regulator [Verrucomicrobia bacterium]|nr:helix-turn-helix transcriptional regulator [Verrucomicrobiota bacterium]